MIRLFFSFFSPFQSEFHDIVRSLNVVLTAMERHLEEKPIQIAASASLFYMVKSEDAKNYSALMKRFVVLEIFGYKIIGFIVPPSISFNRPIVSRLLDAMHRFQNDSTVCITSDVSHRLIEDLSHLRCFVTGV